MRTVGTPHEFALAVALNFVDEALKERKGQPVVDFAKQLTAYVAGVGDRPTGEPGADVRAVVHKALEFGFTERYGTDFARHLETRDPHTLIRWRGLMPSKKH